MTTGSSIQSIIMASIVGFALFLVPVNPLISNIPFSSSHRSSKVTSREISYHAKTLPSDEIVLNPSSLGLLLSESKAEVEACLSMVDLVKVKSLIKDYEIEVAQENFWEDTKAAKKILVALESNKATLARIERWGLWLDDCAAALEILHENGNKPMHERDQGSNVASSSEDQELLLEARDALVSLSKDLQGWRLEEVLSGPYDRGNARLTITAGAGGTDAQDWAQMLQRMYERWAERKGLLCTCLEASDGEGAGIRSADLEIVGPNAYGLLAGEKGTHRLVRVSPFNSLGKRQTSFAAVEVMPILDDESAEAINELGEIPEADLHISFMRSGGAGGQNVNKVESGVLLRHLPTGLTVRCTQERSQLMNRAIALDMLRAKLLVVKLEQKAATLSELRGEAVEATFGQQIRNYVLHPYKVVKDTRTGHETTAVLATLEGKSPLDEFMETWLRHSNRIEAAETSE